MTVRLHHTELDPFYTDLTASLAGEADFTDAGVALYTADASNYRQIPLGVIYPLTIDDIVLATRLCRQYSLNVLMRGGGTSQNGQCVNRAVVIDCSRHLRQVIELDVEAGTAWVQPGIICDSLKAAAEVHGLTFGPDPATHSRCTLGGMIGNNSCGPHSMLAGKTVENVLELDILTAAGDRFTVGPTTDEELTALCLEDSPKGAIYRQLNSIATDYAEQIRAQYPTIKRRVSGYNLDQLLPENHFNVARALVGTEGTCVTVLQAKVQLIKNPAHVQLMVLGFNDIYTAGDTVPDIMPFKPIAMEGLDWTIIGGLLERQLKVDEVALLPDGKAWLLIELAGETAESLQQLCQQFEKAMQNNGAVRSVLPVTDTATTAKIWSIREQGASATAMSLNPDDPDPVVGWEDTAVDPLQIGQYLREFQALVDRYGYTTSLYGHFGDGCIHARITFDTRSKDGVQHWRRFSEEIAKLVIKYGGSLSGEHGDGQAKAEFLPLMFGPELMDAFKRFKQAWDPDNRMNPGKLIEPYRMDENLRFGPDYSTPQVTTALTFTEDPLGFGRSNERCIGMGKCRATSGAMCPSYQVTGEERFSTRGRAHLLHEMLRGEVIRDGWQDTDIRDSLEHCLSCKACQHECPTKVDIAAYKAEFMYQHYAQSKRPLAHYVFGQIGRWLPIMAKAPRLVNALQSTPIGSLARNILGLTDNRTLPQLARTGFSQTLSKRAAWSDEHFYWFGRQVDPAVVLWVDSFSNHYQPQVLDSAVNVLNMSGFSVAVAKQPFCCGRPLYEHGLLDQARRQLDQILSGFCGQLPSDASVIVLEASCLSVFKDELLRLFPNDDRAQDLTQRVGTIAQFLSDKGALPVVTAKLPSAILHLHCHHRASVKDTSDIDWLRSCFDSLKLPESACCGMAGSFGLRKKTAPIAQRLFERRLKPAIDAAGTDVTLITNGFSCREQMQSAGATVKHPVEVMEAVLNSTNPITRDGPLADTMPAASNHNNTGSFRE